MPSPTTRAEAGYLTEPQAEARCWCGCAEADHDEIDATTLDGDEVTILGPCADPACQCTVFTPYTDADAEADAGDRDYDYLMGK